MAGTLATTLGNIGTANLIAGGIGAAVPLIGGLFGDGVQLPTANVVPFRDRSSLESALISSAFDPAEQNRLFQLSAQNLQDQIGRNLFRRGLGQSSIGAQIQNAALSDLQNKFIQNEVQRRAQALGLITQRDVAEANVALANERNRLGIEGQNVGRQLAAQQGLFGGIGNLAGNIGGLIALNGLPSFGGGGGTDIPLDAFANIQGEQIPPAAFLGIPGAA